MRNILLSPMGMDGGGAGASLEAPPMDAGAAPGGNTCSVPADLLPGAKPGDTFKVSAVDGGNVTLEHQPGASGDGAEEWGEGLTKAAAPTEEGGM